MILSLQLGMFDTYKAIYSEILLTYPSVAQSLCFITQGFPKTTECDGTSTLTKLFGAISTSSPIGYFSTDSQTQVQFYT